MSETAGPVASGPGLAGARLLVVGASSGIGRAVASQALDAGATVALLARRTDLLHSAVAEAGGGVAVAADISEPEEADRAVAEAVAALGGLDIVVHTAGVATLRLLGEMSFDEWQTALATNVLGTHSVLRAAVPELTDSGIVAVVSSETTRRHRAGLGAYSASKAAVEAMLATWRTEQPAVRFTNVVLGATQPTEFGSAFDMATMIPLLDEWIRAGHFQQEYMRCDAVASVLLGTLAAMWPHGGVGIDELVLRSPSPVVDHITAM